MPGKPPLIHRDGANCDPPQRLMVSSQVALPVLSCRSYPPAASGMAQCKKHSRAYAAVSSGMGWSDGPLVSWCLGLAEGPQASIDNSRPQRGLRVPYGSNTPGSFWQEYCIKP